MRNLPQEILDMIIDELYELGESTQDYSTVSRAWLNRTQKHHFEFPQFNCGRYLLERWQRAIEPDPLGPSQHVRKLSCLDVNTLEGFDEHIRALTRVEQAVFICCGIFHSLADIQPLTPLGSSLVELNIAKGKTTAAVMTSLLAALPHLRRLLVYDLYVERSEAAPIPIPFFDGANHFNFWGTRSSPGEYDWIPQTARFGHLSVAPSHILQNTPTINQWLKSSAESLEYFHIGRPPHDLDFHGRSLDPLDLSECTTLEKLEFPVPTTEPGKFADIVLPSVQSSNLSTIVLALGEIIANSWDPRDWGTLEKHLCRLARRFKALHGGRLMTVEVRVAPLKIEEPLRRARNEWPMPDLSREAIVKSFNSAGLLCDVYSEGI